MAEQETFTARITCLTTAEDWRGQNGSAASMEHFVRHLRNDLSGRGMEILEEHKTELIVVGGRQAMVELLQDFYEHERLIIDVRTMLNTLIRP